MNSNRNQKINQVSEKHSSSVSILPSVHIMHARLMKEDACSINRSLSRKQEGFDAFMKDYWLYVLPMKKVKFLSVSSPQVTTG